MWELVKAGGWMMLPIILCSIAALAISAERLWTLRPSRVTPPNLLGQVWRWIQDRQLDSQKLKELRASSPLGEVLAAGLANSKHGRDIMKECIQEAAARVIHDLERYLNALGSIAAIAPLLGLLGTVLGMIQSFNVIAFEAGLGKPTLLAAGVSQALITTAFGLIVGIPVMAFFFYFRNKAQEIITDIEITTGEIALMLAGKLKG